MLRGSEVQQNAPLWAKAGIPATIEKWRLPPEPEVSNFRCK